MNEHAEFIATQLFYLRVAAGNLATMGLISDDIDSTLPLRAMQEAHTAAGTLEEHLKGIGYDRAWIESYFARLVDDDTADQP